MLYNQVEDAVVFVLEKNRTVDVFKEFLRQPRHGTIQNNSLTKISGENRY